MHIRNKYQVNARLAASGNKHQKSSGERESPLELGPGKFLAGGGNCSGPHRKCRCGKAQGKEETHSEVLCESKKVDNGETAIIYLGFLNLLTKFFKERFFKRLSHHGAKGGNDVSFIKINKWFRYGIRKVGANFGFSRWCRFKTPS